MATPLIDRMVGLCCQSRTRRSGFSTRPDLPQNQHGAPGVSRQVTSQLSHANTVGIASAVVVEEGRSGAMRADNRWLHDAEGWIGGRMGGVEALTTRTAEAIAVRPRSATVGVLTERLALGASDWTFENVEHTLPTSRRIG